jgi:activator of HSP90 ATPase
VENDKNIKEFEKKVKDHYDKENLKQKAAILGISKFLAGSALIGVFFLQQHSVDAQEMSERINNSDSLKAITIHQEVDFKVSAQKVYEALLDSKEFSDCTKKSFSSFTASSAKIDSREGGAFSVFDGHIIGRIIELVPNERIVQAWRVVDWPAGVYSIARYELKVQGSRTQLVFDHIGFPQGLKEHLSIGWEQHYWDALKRYFK